MKKTNARTIFWHDERDWKRKWQQSLCFFCGVCLNPAGLLQSSTVPLLTWELWLVGGVVTICCPRYWHLSPLLQNCYTPTIRHSVLYYDRQKGREINWFISINLFISFWLEKFWLDAKRATWHFISLSCCEYEYLCSPPSCLCFDTVQYSPIHKWFCISTWYPTKQLAGSFLPWWQQWFDMNFPLRIRPSCSALSLISCDTLICNKRQNHCLSWKPNNKMAGPYLYSPNNHFHSLSFIFL